MNDDHLIHYRQRYEESKERRRNHRQYAQRRLSEAGARFTTHNRGAHLVIQTPAGAVDYWPGTGLFIERRSGRRRRGIAKLLDLLSTENADA